LVFVICDQDTYNLRKQACTIGRKQALKIRKPVFLYLIAFNTTTKLFLIECEIRIEVDAYKKMNEDIKYSRIKLSNKNSRSRVHEIKFRRSKEGTNRSNNRRKLKLVRMKKKVHQIPHIHSTL